MLTVRVKVALIFIIIFIIGLYIRYCGHSMGVIPGLVSIPVVKSFCVLFVYYGFLWEFHFAASLSFIIFISFFVFLSVFILFI